MLSNKRFSRKPFFFFKENITSTAEQARVITVQNKQKHDIAVPDLVCSVKQFNHTHNRHDKSENYNIAFQGCYTAVSSFMAASY